MGLIQFPDAPGGVSSSGAKAARLEDAVLLLELAWKTWLRGVMCGKFRPLNQHELNDRFDNNRTVSIVRRSSQRVSPAEFYIPTKMVTALVRPRPLDLNRPASLGPGLLRSPAGDSPPERKGRGRSAH